MFDFVRAEWIKLCSTGSTWYALLGAAAGGVGLPVLVAWQAVRIWDSAPAALRAHMRVTPLAPFGAWLVDLALAVLGVLSITTEYSTGMIRTSLTAAPRRPSLIAAKAIAVSAFSLLAAAATVFACCFLTRWVVGHRPIPLLTYPLAQEIPVLLSLVLAAAVFALVGLGAGALLRSATAAMVTVVGLGYALPIIALHLPAPWNGRMAAVLLSNLGGELSGAPRLAAVAHPLLSPPAALAAMAGYLAIALGGAAVAITRRDAA